MPVPPPLKPDTVKIEYIRLVEAHLSHNRQSFNATLLCDRGGPSPIPVAVAAQDWPLLVPYLVLLGDSRSAPLLVEPPVVPAAETRPGVWCFCAEAALVDREPVPPEPGTNFPTAIG